MQPVEAPVPRFLAETGHKGMIYREPYGVARFDHRPVQRTPTFADPPGARRAFAAGNTCILTLSEALTATTEVLLDLVPKYFDPSAVTVVPGGKSQNTELLKLAFDLLHLFSPAAPTWGRSSREPPRKTSRRSCWNLGGMNPALVDEGRQHPRRCEEDRLGCDGVGRPVVHLSRLRVCSQVCRRRLRCRGQGMRRSSCLAMIRKPTPTNRASSTLVRWIDSRRSSTRRKWSRAASRIRTPALPRPHAALSGDLGRQGLGG